MQAHHSSAPTQTHKTLRNPYSLSRGAKLRTVPVFLCHASAVMWLISNQAGKCDVATISGKPSRRRAIGIEEEVACWD